MNIRKIALGAIERIIYKGGYSNVVVNEYLNKFEFSNEDKNLFTKLVLGTVEKKITLAYYLEPFLRKKQKPWVNVLLLMSLYQLIYLNIPDYAVVNAAVDIANMTDMMVGNFINGVLRNFLRNELRSLDEKDPIKYLSIKYSYPSWLIAYLLKDYNQEEVIKLLEYNEESKLTSIRINTLLATKEEVITYLKENDIEYQNIDIPLSYQNIDLFCDSLYTSSKIINTSLFKEGKVTIQDVASQLASKILNPSKNSLILDLCSAPGGKSAHLSALMQNSGTIYACDVHSHKMKLMEKNFKRLGVQNIKLQLIDARHLKRIVKEESFDYILADLPCSGLGVMSHKVDLKYNVTLDNINDIIKLQKEILSAAAPLLKNNGYLLYSTCTINKSENEEIVKWFLENNQDYYIDYEQKIMPFMYGTDGFYICKLGRKKETHE